MESSSSAISSSTPEQTSAAEASTSGTSEQTLTTGQRKLSLWERLLQKIYSKQEFEAYLLNKDRKRKGKWGGGKEGLSAAWHIHELTHCFISVHRKRKEKISNLGGEHGPNDGRFNAVNDQHPHPSTPAVSVHLASVIPVDFCMGPFGSNDAFDWTGHRIILSSFLARPRAIHLHWISV